MRARYYNIDNTRIEIIFDDGHSLISPMPPIDGEALEAYNAHIAAGGEVEAYLPYASLAEAIDARLKDLAARRWKAQTSFSYDGVENVAFGADTAGNLLAVMQYLAAAPQGTVTPWKLGRGEHRSWTLPQIQMFAFALQTYMAQCFVNESTIAAEIMAQPTQIEAISVDIETGWPQ